MVKKCGTHATSLKFNNYLSIQVISKTGRLNNHQALRKVSSVDLTPYAKFCERIDLYLFWRSKCYIIKEINVDTILPVAHYVCERK